MMYIFSLPTHWAGIRELLRKKFVKMGNDERVLSFTPSNKRILSEFVSDARICVCHDDPRVLRQLVSGKSAVTDLERTKWIMSAGDFHSNTGGPC